MKLRSALVLLGLAASAAVAQVDYVDPTIGNVAWLLVPTRPTAHLPNSMVRVYPLRTDALDDRIESFPLTLISHRLGELFSLQAGTGPVTDKTWTTPVTYDHEKPTPYHYSVWLEEPRLQLDFAPGAQTGLFRVTGDDAAPTLLLANRQPGELRAVVPQAVAGQERFSGMQAYVYGEFEQPVKLVATVARGHGRIAATPVDAAARTLQFRYAISFISVQQAQRNLRRELSTWNLDQVAAAGRARWNDALGRIQVTGGTDAQKRVFYTALYRCYERMINITEDGRYYSAYDHQVHQDARPFYVDNWIWDTYRALEPLHMIINPGLEADKIASYVRMYEQSGWMPTFAVLWGEHACMTGNHAAAWMADAYMKGIRNFDVTTAYAGLRKNTLERTLLPWRSGPATSLDKFFAEHGYMPALAPGEEETVPEVNAREHRQAVSVTLEHALDDWCLAQLARGLGKTEDMAWLLQRAGWWHNVFRDDKGFMWPRNARGEWIEPFDPKFSGGQGGRAYFTENNGYTYNWHPVHDLTGLFTAMGGRKAAEAKLDNLFREDIGRPKYEYFATFPDSTGMVGEFSMANEPSFAIPYLYDYTGAPWKTQKRIRQLLEVWFPDNLFGIPGDEDGGGMSAFVVFSMMGFYPVTSGVPVYALGSPVFDQVDIRLPGGKTFTIAAHGTSRDHKYVQQVRLNGAERSRVWFTHRELTEGGRLDLEMSGAPNLQLGTRPEDLPPSGVSFDPSTLE